MTTRSGIVHFRTSLFFVTALATSSVFGCDAPAPTDAGIDGGGPDACVGCDAGRDGGRDGGPTDVRLDVASDAPADAGTDAPPRDVSAAVAATLDWVCGVQAYAECTAPWACDCNTFGDPPPRDVAACEASRRAECDGRLGPYIETEYRRYGARLDEAALAACLALARASFDACLPDPVPPATPPAACLDAVVLDTPVGVECPVDGIRCASGDGVCVGSLCEPAPSTAGASCIVACSGGLRCVDGTCGDAVSAGGACSDHEDCAGSELCVGGRCAPRLATGASCTSSDACGLGEVCAGDVCAPSSADDCDPSGTSDCGASRECALSEDQRCVRQGSVGDPCFGDKECLDTLACDDSSGACAALPSEGAPCGSRCESGLLCVEDNRTSVRTCRRPGRAGEPCADLFALSGALCEAGLGCTSGTCQAAPGLGAPCADDRICEPGLTCSNSNVCATPGVDGAPCDDVPCTDGLFCDYDVSPAACRPLLGLGADCTFGFCAPDLDCRYDSTLATSLCVTPGALGEPCASVCEPGAFCGMDPTAGTCRGLICPFVTGGGVIID